MRAAPDLTQGIEIDEPAARLVVLGALLWWQDNVGRPSRWAPADWDRAFSVLQPREVVTVVLHAVRGWTLERIGEWLDVSRGMAHILWKRACIKLREKGPL